MRWQKWQQLCLNVFFYFLDVPSHGSSPQRYLWYVKKLHCKCLFSEGRSSFSPIVNGLLGLAIRLASKLCKCSKYDALGALAVVDVEALTNCFCSCSCFFPSKYSEGLLLTQSAWSPSGETVLKASLPHRRAGRPILCFGGWESPVAIHLYLK